MPATLETLLGLYKEQADQARHHEELRATVTNVVIAVAGALFALVRLDQGGASLQRPMGAFLVALGVFGALVSAKHYERNRHHARLARAYRQAIEALDPGTKVKRRPARKKHERRFPRLKRIPLWSLWVGIHAFVCGVGVMLMFA